MFTKTNILIFCIIGVLLLIIYNYINNKTPIIIFLSQYKLSSILKTDMDKYYTNLSHPNLRLRNISNKQHFLDNISNYVYECNKSDKTIINNAIKKANISLNQIKYPGFYYHKLYNYPWIIGCSNLEKYEFGYPHTRNNIIILNNQNIYDQDLYKTLIHERVHIYQKLFPTDIQEFLLHYKFTKKGLQNQYDRANPDTDNYIYERDNIIYECKIESENFDNDQSKIMCTHNSSKYEHPYELMAYEISELCD